MNRFFLRTSTFPLCFVGCCISWLLLASDGDSAEKPNVLFLFADDFTCEAISAFGHTDIETPNLDQQIGRILDSLDRSGKADNTYIFFTADHGLAVGNHGFFGKQNMYDHSIRVPFVVVGPEAKPNHTITAPIYLQDVMATTLELAQVPKPSTTEFHSVLPLLRGETEVSKYPAIYGAYLHLQRCVIADQWKLIVYPKTGITRLYDLKSDPLEMNDLSDDPAQLSRIKTLQTELVGLQSQLGDSLRLQP